MTERIERLKNYIEENKLDAVVVSTYENYRYFSGFTGSNCRLVITPDRGYLLTDGRYTTQAEEQTKGFEILTQRRAGNEHLIETLRMLKLSRVGYESMKLSDYEVREIRTATPELTWVPLMDFGGVFRMIKDAEEIKCITRAVEIADSALDMLVPDLRSGLTEREVAAKLEYCLSMQGSERPAFEMIAASGVRGALPHGAPTDRVINSGEMLTLDFGACYCGYLSDITRTLWIGKPSDEMKRVWDIVYEAQRASVEAVRPGITGNDLDAVHRKIFAHYGMQEHIMHSLGHGVGLVIHEEPRISPNSKFQLRENMVITIEPGLYLPGIGGVRTEDTVLITKDGALQLTKSKHLIQIN